MRTLITFLFALLLAAGNTIAQPGAIDPTFNAGDFGFGYGDGPDEVTSMALQPDGKIVLGGVTTYSGIPRNGIARINADGSLDTSFDPGSGANGGVSFVALQPDGKIIIGGYFTTYGGTNRNRIARLNADGSLDATFDPGLGANGPVHHVLIQPDGKVLIGGAFSEFNTTPKNQLCRLNVNGSLDISYTANWYVPPYYFTGISSLCLEPSGMLLVGGSSGGSGTGVARLHSNGGFDSSYPINGPNSIIRSIVKLPDGNVLIGGGGFWNGAVIPIFQLRDEWGNLITGFASGGGPSNSVGTILPLPNNKILISGNFTHYAAIPRNGIAQLNYDGSLDLAFDPGLSYRIGERMVRQADGKIVATGGPSRLTRLNANGSLDAGFPLPGTGANGEVRAIAVQPDGKILIGGGFQAYNGVVTRLTRLQPDGGLDTNFETTLPGSSNLSSIALQSNGKVLIAGTFPERIARFNSDGSPDNGFSPPQIDDLVQAVAAQPDGRIMIGGLFTTVGGQSRNRVARLNADGSVHLSFDPGNGADGAVRTIVPMPAGKTLIGGAFNNYGGFSMAHVAQLNADGTLDPAFNIGAGITDDTVRVIVRQSDGKVLVAGDFYVFNGVYSPNIVRLNTDGSMDTTFSSGFGVDGRIHCMALQADGRILIGGEFSTYDGIGRNRIARLNSDGSLDMGFNPGTGASATIHALALQPDGKALIGGAFTSYNGTGRNRVARLHNDIGSGVRENESPALFLHPNPTTGIVTLQLPLQAGASRLSVLDATGRLLLSRSSTTGPITLDLSGHESGVYFVQVRFADGTRAVERVVKE